MKQILLATCCLFLVCSNVKAQKPETFDGVSYTMPKGWQKNVEKSAVQLAVGGAKGTCLITLFKAIPGSDDSKANFKASWDTIVKETIKVSTKPEMQPATKENGWIIETGIAPYELEGKKGLALLMTMTGNSKVINLLMLSDTDAYQADVDTFMESIHLPKVTAKASPSVNKPEGTATTPSAPRKSAFQFNTTNFDDGWTAVEQTDWVRVTKGNLAVLVHYPNAKADAYNSVLKAGLLNAWNILVAPRYTNVQNFALKPIQSFESISFVEADAQDKSTGKTVHIVLFKKDSSAAKGKYIEFIAPSQSEYEQEFGAYRKNEFGWDKLVNMAGRNRFDISSKDLVGKWSTQDYASLAYYYVNTGGFAGATATSTADMFTFSPSGTYQSDHSGASGVVGNQKFSRQVYKGNFTAKNWKMTLTNRFMGKSETYDCWFEAVKGGRILMMKDTRNSVRSLAKE
jgi:hypothetical protein